MLEKLLQSVDSATFKRAIQHEAFSRILKVFRREKKRFWTFPGKRVYLEMSNFSVLL